MPTLTIPLKVDRGASTCTIGAVTSTETLACTSTEVAVSRTVQPAACRTVAASRTSWAASSRTTWWPDAIVIWTFAAPRVSSNSSRLSARERSSRMSFDSSGSCGSVSRPFQAQPTT